jgi:hypothetical protein
MGCYHTTSDSIERVRSETGTSCYDPSERERGKEVTLECASKEDGFERIVHTEVETSIDNDTSDGRTEPTVQSADTVGSKGLPVDIDQTVELTFTTYINVRIVLTRDFPSTFLCGFSIVGQSSTSVIQRVDEQKTASTGGTTRSQVTGEPLHISISLFLESEQLLEVIFSLTMILRLSWRVVYL